MAASQKERSVQLLLSTVAIGEAKPASLDSQEGQKIDKTMACLLRLRRSG